MATNTSPASTLFEIRRRHLGDPMSRMFPAGYVSLGTGLTIYPRGTAVGSAGANSSVQDIASGVPASGSNFLGFLTRDVVDNGPTLSEIILPTNPLALPFTAGDECSLEKAEEVECEGTLYIKTSGTGAITSSTAIGTNLSFDGLGRFYVAQSGDTAFFELTGNSGLPGNGPVPTVVNNLRILAESLVK